MDVRAKVAMSIGVGALALGVVAFALSVPVLGIAAGVLAVAAAGCTVAIDADRRTALEDAATARADAERMRADLQALTAVFTPGGEESVAPAAAADPTAESDATPTDVEAVYEPISGLLDRRYFAVLVQQRVAAARRHLQPVSVAIFQIDPPRVGSPNTEEAMRVLGEVLRSTLRECDAVCSLGPSRAGAVLDGTAERGAVWATERVRNNLRAHPVGRSLTISTGIASYPTHALGASELLSLGTYALHAACRRGADSVEIAPAG